MRILLCLTALLFATSAWADCMSQLVSYWPPPNATISSTPIILIEGMGGDQARVKGLKSASLVAPGHHVELEKMATHVGGFELTQTVWTPTEALKAGQTYRLVAQGKSKTWRPSQYVPAARKRLPLKYTVASTSASAAAWSGPPTLGKASWGAFGCGPAIYQSVTLPAAHPDGLVEVTVTGGAAPQTYVLPLPADGVLNVGHGMCSGAFLIGGSRVPDETQFKASFALLQGPKVRVPAQATLSFPAVTPAQMGR